MTTTTVGLEPDGTRSRFISHLSGTTVLSEARNNACKMSLYESVGIIDFLAQCHCIQVTIGILTPDLNANALRFVRAAAISVGVKSKQFEVQKKRHSQGHAWKNNNLYILSRW